MARDRPRVGIFSAFPLEYFGGGERFIIRLARMLSERGYRPTLFADTGGTSERRIAPAELDALLPVPYSRIDYQQPSLLPVWRGLFSRVPPVEALAPFDANLIFVNRLPPPSYLLRLRPHGRSSCLMVHGLDVSAGVPGDALAAAYKGYLQVGLAAVSPALRISGLMVQLLTAEAAEIAHRSGIPSEQVVVIPNAIEIGSLRVGRDDAGFDVVFLGRLAGIQKGTDLLVEFALLLAKQSVGEVTVSIIGSGPSAESLQVRLAGTPSARVLGHVDEGKKLELLARANLMLSTSVLDPFPVSLLEGLAAGLPLVAAPSGGARYVLSLDPSFGHLARASPESLVTIVRREHERWRGDPEGYYQLKLRRRSAMERRFRIDEMNGAYCALVDRLAEGRG